MNTTEEISRLIAKVSPNTSRKESEAISINDFLREQEATANSGPQEIVSAVANLKNEALKLGHTPLGLKYYTEARMMENSVLPLVNETVAADIEDKMIELQRNAVMLSAGAMKKLVNSRNKQLEELQLTNKSLSKVTGGFKGLKSLFKKVEGEQHKLFDTVGAVSFSSGPVISRDILESVSEQWKKDLTGCNNIEQTQSSGSQ